MLVSKVLVALHTDFLNDIHVCVYFDYALHYVGYRHQTTISKLLKKDPGLHKEILFLFSIPFLLTYPDNKGGL